jgi:hypothetical protein
MEGTLVLIYEPGQVDDVASYVQTNPGATVISLDFWAERALKQKGIPCRSSTQYCPLMEDHTALLEQAETIAREWYRLPQMAFFEYRNIRIAEALEPDFDSYLQLLLRRIHIVARVLLAHPFAKHIVVPCSKREVPPTSPPLTSFELNSLADVATFLGKPRNITVTVLGKCISPDAIRSFPPQSRLRFLALHMYNGFIGLLPRRSLKLFASEYWSHIAPFIENMDDAELVLMDRSEIRVIPWRQLLKHRIRFLHPLDEATPAIRSESSRWQRQAREHWVAAKPSVAAMPEFMHGGISWWPLVEQGFDFIVEKHAERVVSDIDSIEKILRDERTDKVLLRASVSAQHHFFVIAKISQLLGIPSIEVQHAGAVLDPHSVHSRFESSHLAAYGALTAAMYVRNHGYAPNRIRAIGSPRFDRYLNASAVDEVRRVAGLRALGLDPSRPVMLAAVQAEGAWSSLTPTYSSSYDTASFFRTLRNLQLMNPQIQFILKFRSRGCTAAHRDYIGELFSDGGVAISEDDLFSMLMLADFASSGSSTAMYETMLANKPLVLFPWKPTAVHDIAIYGKAAPLVYTDADLVNEIRRLLTDGAYLKDRMHRQESFLAEQYSFDGHASERMAALLREPLQTFPKS